MARVNIYAMYVKFFFQFRQLIWTPRSGTQDRSPHIEYDSGGTASEALMLVEKFPCRLLACFLKASKIEEHQVNISWLYLLGKKL